MWITLFKLILERTILSSQYSQIYYFINSNNEILKPSKISKDYFYKKFENLMDLMDNATQRL